jgi:cellulose synthase/poly-beta-1,6-N-acetylglucosamine synthase-like glycosyltransferase
VFASGISIVALIRGNTPTSKITNFLKSIDNQECPRGYMNVTIICAHSDENQIYKLGHIFKKHNVLLRLVRNTEKPISIKNIKHWALNYTPTEWIIFCDLDENSIIDNWGAIDSSSNIPGVFVYQQSAERILSQRMNRVTAVIPANSTLFIPPLRNCLRGVRKQSFDQKKVNIIVTYVHRQSKENLQGFIKLCASRNAAIMFYRHSHPHFPPALARNVGARRVINAVTAFVDADTIMHPHTFQKALFFMKDGNTVIHVEPSMITGIEPSSPHFQDMRRSAFEAIMNKGRYAPGTGACIFVPADILEKTHGYDERFIGYGATDWDFTERLPPLGVEFINLSKKYGNIRAIHQPHPRRNHLNPPSASNRSLYARLKGKQPKRNLNSWGGIPVIDHQESES